MAESQQEEVAGMVEEGGMTKEELVQYLMSLFEQDSFYSAKYGSSRCTCVDGWFCNGLRDNIVGEILEKIEEGWL